MSALLDSVIENTSMKARIVSEQHDVNRINVGGVAPTGRPSDGLRRQIESLNGGGWWDEAEYGISRVAQVAKLEDSLARAVAFEATPEGVAAARAEVERAMSEMRTRAVRRASLDTSTGKVAVMVAGEAPWHGLGVNVAEAVSSEEAIKLASLDWSVEKKPLGWVDAEGVWHDSEAAWGIVRGDTNSCLGTVGSRYTPFQNSEAFAFLDSVIGEFGARYETAGAIYGGQQVWMLVNLPRQAFKVRGQDEVAAYAIFVNSHNGTGSAKCLPTTLRAVCGNSLRATLADGKGSGISIRHTGNLKAKVAEARKAIGITINAVDRLHENLDVLAVTKAPDPIGYFDGILDHVCEVTAAQAMMGVDALAATLAVAEADAEVQRKWAERQIARRENLLQEVLERYESERCGVNGVRGTAYSVLQAVTETIDHSKQFRYTGSTETKASRRFENVLYGEGDTVKQIAYQNAVAMAN